MSHVQIINAPVKYDCEHLVGTFLDESNYDTLIDSDTDFYGPKTSFDGGNDETNILFKFRKNVFSTELQKSAYDGLINAAIQSQNRGMAAGPKGMKLQNRDWVNDWQAEALDILLHPKARLDGQDPLVLHIQDKPNWKEESSRGIVWLRSKVLEKFGKYEGVFDEWLVAQTQVSLEERVINANKMIDECISATSYANPVLSGIAGFFDRYPRIDWGRACSYNEHNPEMFALSFPYLEHLDQEFKKLLPLRYATQRACADQLDPRFLIGHTVFTTLTINKNFRTAAHRDAGDLGRGFSNLCVISTGKDFLGGYLVLPEYRVAINIRPGDMLLVANHDAIHGNTPIKALDGSDDVDALERMSIVAYFREKMLNLGSWDYEQTRREFIEGRRRNQSHPLWRPLWNGISPSWDTSEEWYEYLRQKNVEFLHKYHPEAFEKSPSSLDHFFV